MDDTKDLKQSYRVSDDSDSDSDSESESDKDSDSDKESDSIPDLQYCYKDGKVCEEIEALQDEYQDYTDGGYQEGYEEKCVEVYRRSVMSGNKYYLHDYIENLGYEGRKYREICAREQCAQCNFSLYLDNGKLSFLKKAVSKGHIPAKIKYAWVLLNSSYINAYKQISDIINNKNICDLMNLLRRIISHGDVKINKDILQKLKPIKDRHLCDVDDLYNELLYQLVIKVL